MLCLLLSSTVRVQTSTSHYYWGTDALGVLAEERDDENEKVGTSSSSVAVLYLVSMVYVSSLGRES